MSPHCIYLMSEVIRRRGRRWFHVMRPAYFAIKRFCFQPAKVTSAANEIFFFPLHFREIKCCLSWRCDSHALYLYFTEYLDSQTHHSFCCARHWRNDKRRQPFVPSSHQLHSLLAVNLLCTARLLALTFLSTDEVTQQECRFQAVQLT